MKRLRHPIRAIREPFGTAGLVVACVALIAALGGTALAAAKLNSTQKKEVEKIAKKYAGKPGAPGAQGPAGPAGGAGKDGSNGTNGTNGTDGEDGTDGAPGKSVVVKAVTPGEEGALEECEERGGSEVEVQGAGGAEAEICNGKEGPEGPEGSPWTDGGTLPPGATETGAWSINGTTADTGGVYAPISFPIPLKQSVEGEGPENHVHYSTDADFETYCAEPAIIAGPFQPDALPGEVCIWQIENTNAEFDSVTPGSGHGESERAGKFGALLHFSLTGVAFASGSWAVTGCEGATGPTKCP
jgi:hypothetical protein